MISKLDPRAPRSETPKVPKLQNKDFRTYVDISIYLYIYTPAVVMNSDACMVCSETHTRDHQLVVLSSLSIICNVNAGRARAGLDRRDIRYL